MSDAAAPAPITIALHGAGGRMGRAIAKAALESEGSVRVVAAVDRDGSPLLGRDVGELVGSPACGVLVAPNTSVGVNVLFHLAAEAARLLGPDFDAEIVEAHHRHKVDAPSGTAVRLAERVRDARGAGRFVHGRSGQVGARKSDEIGVLALRGGDVIGEHTLSFFGPGERVELTHRAHDRSLFAKGALVAARFVARAAPGRYDMADAIGLRRA